MRTIQTSHFSTLPVVMFTNKALNARKVWICTSAAAANRCAEQLRAQDHITDVEVVDAPVKD